MKKFILIPDSFKGTMSSSEICAIMAKSIHTHFPESEIISIPVADGGEGSVDCFIEAVGGEKIYCTVKNPFFEDMECCYGLIDNGKTAVIEMSSCAGLPLIEDRLNPLESTTYGVGQLMLDAAGRGVGKIIIGLGGSSTNDGGCGAAAAVGVRFLKANGEEFVPTGGTLKDIASIDTSKYYEKLKNIEIITMCDIDNPMHGLQGAAHIFGPQKGADESMVQFLDAGLVHLDRCIQVSLKQDVSAVPGAGAAGAMGAGMLAFFGARLQMGITTVLDAVLFDEKLRSADMVLTGEGRIDSQSLRGKVVIGVARRAKLQNVPVVAVVGDIKDPVESVYDEGVSAVFSINRVAVDFAKAKPRAKTDLALTVDTIMRFYSIAKQ